MGNASTKVIPMMKTRDNRVYKPIPPPIPMEEIWKEKMQDFMKNHILQLQNYSENEIDYVKQRLKRFEDGTGIPFRSLHDPKFKNAIIEVMHLMSFVGDWPLMLEHSDDIVRWYLSQKRQKEMEEIAFVFCVLVIEPQIIKIETR